MPLKVDVALSSIGLIICFGLLFLLMETRDIVTQVDVGVNDMSHHRVVGSLIYHVLQAEGYKVNRFYADHEENFGKLKDGNIDMMVSAWLPYWHGKYKDEVEETVPLVQLGPQYKAKAMWGVPDYVPEDELDDFDDLLKPEVLNRTKHLIVGINEDESISHEKARIHLQIMEEYGLTEAGYTFEFGTPEECYKAFEDGVTEGEWVIIPLWEPHFLHHIYDIRALQEPKGLLGGEDDSVILLREDRKSHFDDDDLDILDALRWDDDDISELDYLVTREGRELDVVTKEWLDRHPIKK